MTGKQFWKYIPSPGPVLSLALIGLVLLSGLLYYRAIKIQRFLEPALALSQPRNEFGKSINRIYSKEFGAKSVPGIKVKTSSILIDKSILYRQGPLLEISSQVHVQKIARIFLNLLEDEHMRSEISSVLIIGRFPSYGNRQTHLAERIQTQHLIGLIQDALFEAEPKLGARYASYFSAVAQPTGPKDGNKDIVELRIIPSEFLHIEVLERLEKYSY